MRALGLRQLSVSLPLKEAVLGLADRASEAARAIGAANTLTRAGDELIADNTDWIGVRRALEPLGSWRGSRALVLGAGGAARAAVYALRQLGARVGVHARTRARAERLVADLDAQLAPADAPWDLLVNATPVGMQPAVDATPLAAEHLGSAGTVFDLVYRPLETRLLREARLLGCRTQDGLDMLVHQAVEQIRLWSGRSASPARLRAAALAALGEN
jgi:shikimate dehydrogenase